MPDGPDRHPDLLVFDLDPGLPATITQCCAVALDLRPMLQADGLEPLAKTSGGKGMQLYARIDGMTAAQASDLALAYANRMTADHPDQVLDRLRQDREK